jgi:hypothetical protein
MLCSLMLGVLMLRVLLLSVDMSSVIMSIIFMLSVIMLGHIAKVSLRSVNMPVSYCSASILSVMFSVADAQCQYAECPCNNTVAEGQGVALLYCTL